MRLYSYMKAERAIIATDGDTIIQRWKWGRRLLLDDTATTPNGNLRHGVLDRLLNKAKAEGIKLSEREIRYRLQCAKVYQTEAEIGTASADFQDWTSLRQAGFPPVEVDDPGKSYDPRHGDEKDRDNARKIRRAAAERWMQALPGFDEYTTLGELQKLLAERQELTARRLREESTLAIDLQQLIDAVDGDLSATYAEAQEALDAQNGVTEDDEDGDEN